MLMLYTSLFFITIATEQSQQLKGEQQLLNAATEGDIDTIKNLVSHC